MLFLGEMFPQTTVAHCSISQCGERAVRAPPSSWSLEHSELTWMSGKVEVGVSGVCSAAAMKPATVFHHTTSKSPILILVLTHFLSPDTNSSCWKDINKSSPLRSKPVLHRLEYDHDHDTIIGLRRLARRFHCRYVIPSLWLKSAHLPLEPTLFAHASVIQRASPSRITRRRPRPSSPGAKVFGRFQRTSCVELPSAKWSECPGGKLYQRCRVAGLVPRVG